MIKDFTSANVPDQSGKTFFITGANTGIGFEAATVIAARGGRVLLGSRNPAKGQVAMDRIVGSPSRSEGRPRPNRPLGSRVGSGCGSRWSCRSRDSTCSSTMPA